VDLRQRHAISETSTGETRQLLKQKVLAWKVQPHLSKAQQKWSHPAIQNVRRAALEL